MDINLFDYELYTTREGFPTFKLIGTREILHSHVGPAVEANDFYLANARLEERNSAVIYDVGLGCGFLTLTTIAKCMTLSQLNHVEVLSFDIEKSGLKILKEHFHLFPELESQKFILEKMLELDEFEIPLNQGKLSWKFIRGDFAQKDLTKFSKPNIIFFDFFSPTHTPQLWQFSMFKKLADVYAEDVTLLTYSRATAVRANILASGLYVGECSYGDGLRTGSVACSDKNKVPNLLPKEWLRKFDVSTAQFVVGEKDSAKEVIASNVKNHPQFV